jgi:hypothetical protein
MPVVPTVGAAPYDTVDSVLNLARVRINDAIQTIGGDTLKNTAQFTQVIFNAAWRKMQDSLANKGYDGLVERVILTGIPATTDLDPASQCFVDWTQAFIGGTYYDAPVLPFDLIVPLKVWERPTGQGWGFSEMTNYMGGLPSCMKQGFNRVWQWHGNRIEFPGSLAIEDFQIEYAKYLADFLDATDDQGLTVPWYTLQVPIVRCQDALADYVAFEFTAARGDADALAFQASAEAKTGKIFNREVRQKQRVNLRRISRSAGARCGSNWLY